MGGHGLGPGAVALLVPPCKPALSTQSQPERKTRSHYFKRPVLRVKQEIGFFLQESVQRDQLDHMVWEGERTAERRRCISLWQTEQQHVALLLLLYVSQKIWIFGVRIWKTRSVSSKINFVIKKDSTKVNVIILEFGYTPS